MGQPTPYAPSFDFTDFQAAHPSDPVPADELDVQFNSIATVTEHICDRLQLIQRDDGALANLSVGIDQLKPEVDIGINSAADWVTGHNYIIRDAVYYGTGVYRCIVSHTSDTFATDLATGKWQLIIDLDITGDATIAVAAAAAAAASAVTAASTADAAAVSAVDAASQAAALQACAYRYLFEASTTMGLPITGALRFNNATIGSVTAIAMNAVSHNTGAPNIRAIINTWDDSTSVTRGTLTLRSVSNPSTFAVFRITGVTTDNTTWQQLAVTFTASNGTFGANDDIAIDYAASGDSGTLAATFITSTSATAFGVGRTGGNPALNINTVNASGVTGWNITANAAGGGSIMAATSSNANEDATIAQLGTGTLNLGNGTGGVTSKGNFLVQNGASLFAVTPYQTTVISNQRTANLIGFQYSPFNSGSFSASTETPMVQWGVATANNYAAGAKTLQRDFLIKAATNTASGATSLATAATFGVEGAPIAGTNMSQTASCGIYVGSSNVGASTTNSFGAIINSQTGAAGGNYAASFLGGKTLFDAATTSYASINLAPGSAPSSPINGDIWTTSAGVYAQIGSLTKRLDGAVIDTAVATTSGTAVNYTSIPAGIKRITICFAGVSTTGSDALSVKLGSGSILSSGYVGASGGYNLGGNDAVLGFSSSFTATNATGSTYVISGMAELVLMDVVNNIWAFTANTGTSASPGANYTSAGHVQLSGAIDRLQISTTGGTDTFDAGKVNIIYT